MGEDQVGGDDAVDREGGAITGHAAARGLGLGVDDGADGGGFMRLDIDGAALDQGVADLHLGTAAHIVAHNQPADRGRVGGIDIELGHQPAEGHRLPPALLVKILPRQIHRRAVLTHEAVEMVRRAALSVILRELDHITEVERLGAVATHEPVVAQDGFGRRRALLEHVHATGVGGDARGHQPGVGVNTGLVDSTDTDRAVSDDAHRLDQGVGRVVGIGAAKTHLDINRGLSGKHVADHRDAISRPTGTLQRRSLRGHCIAQGAVELGGVQRLDGHVATHLPGVPAFPERSVGEVLRAEFKRGRFAQVAVEGTALATGAVAVVHQHRVAGDQTT